MDRSSLIALAALTLAACGGDRASPADDEKLPAANAALPASNAASTAGSPSGAAELEATFAGLDRGDHLWATFEPAGSRPTEPALVDDVPIAAFLKAHEGQRVSVRIETVNRVLDPPGERMDVRTVTSARRGATRAQDWWARLTSAQREAAERSVLDGGGG
ncbi:MAG TPA: hypothetical protein VF702_12355 [Allosphingosinicella sp.]|jgi:hypothetical protein